MVNKIGIALIILVILFVIILAQNVDNDEKLEVSVMEVNEKIENKEEILLLDVRSASEFEGNLGHIDSSVLIPLSDLEDKLDELTEYKDKEIIVICARGIRSEMAADMLRKNGFNALNMEGGMIAYQAMEKENESEKKVMRTINN